MRPRDHELDTDLRTIVNTLLDSLNDKNESVNAAVKKSLWKIANVQNVDTVLCTCSEYRTTKKKLHNGHVANILSTIEQICMQKAQTLDLNTVEIVLNITLDEMVSNKDYIPSVQMPASGVLVALSNAHPQNIITRLADLLQPGVIPHYTIPHTLGTIAAANSHGILPFMKSILAKMLPTLGMLKNDPLKQAFAYALGNFSMALMDYLSNNTNEENVLAKDNLSTEFSIAFDVLFLHWVNSNEPKVVETILEAMGPMTNLLSNEKHEMLVAKLVQNIFPLYRKPNLDSYFVTQAVTYILTRTVNKNKILLTSAMIESINSTLFSLVLTLPDYDQPQKIKNHFEVLRCFDILLINFPNFTLEFLYQHAKINNEEEKMKSIVILTHLLTSSEKVIVENFISILKDNIVIESSVKMKRVLLKAIVALAYRQNLKEPDNCVLYEFIIKYICNTKEEDMSENDIFDLFNDCENSLYLLSSTVNDIKPVLWPLLLKAFLQAKYSNSISILAKCLIQLMQIDSEDNESAVTNGKLHTPSNEAIFVRSLSLLNYPYNEKLYRNILNFLLKFCEDIHKNLAISWELDLKNHLTYLNSKDFSAVVWESMMLDLFRSAIYLVNDNSWVECICHKILEQIPQCESCISQKGILYKFLAILLCNMVDQKTVEYRLDTYFNALPNAVTGEEDYLAEALGIASIKHGLRIVEKLDELCKDIESRKASRFLKFNFMKNPKQDTSINNLKQTITLCYGYVARELLDFQILEKLIRTDAEGCGSLIRWLVNILQSTSTSFNLMRASISTIHLLAKAIQVIPHNIVLHDRWKLLNLVLDQMLEKNSTKDDIELFPKIIDATTSLALLPKHLVPEERNAVLRLIYSKVSNSINFLENKINTKQLDEDEFSNLVNDIQCSLDSLVKEFIMQSTCPSTLDDMLSILDEWITSDSRTVRLAALRSTQVALSSFIQNIKLTYENPSRFNQSGLLMGRMISRCSDEYSTIRSTSVNCIKILIQIINLYDGRLIDPQCESALSKLEKEIASDDPLVLSNAIEHIGDIVSDKVQHQQIMQLTETLLFGLQINGSSGKGCNVVLNIIFKSKGQDFYQNVNDIMGLVLKTLQKINGAEKDALLQVMLTFTRHHLKPVVAYLLMQPLPFEKCVCECWNVLAHDSSIALHTVEYFMSVLQTEPLFEESHKYDSGKVATVEYLSVISALCEVLSQSQTKNICTEKFAELFAALYTTLVCFIGASPPAHSIQTEKKNEKFGFIPNSQSVNLSPVRITIDTMKALLINANCIKVLDVFLLCNQLETTELLNSFLDIAHSIVAVFCEDYPQHLSKLVMSLNQYARCSLISQRIAVVAFFSHLVTFRCIDNLVMLDTVMATLNAGWRDTALEVRAVSLSGLSNVKHLQKDQRESLMQSVILNLYHGLDDHQGNMTMTNVPLISMINLTEFLLLDAINNELLELYSPISHRIKAFMNTENPALREASIRLFGEIAYRHQSDGVKEQAFTLFPCFLLHLADDDVDVVKACKQTLKKVCPNFDTPNSNTMIQNHLIDSAKLHITSFTTDLIKCMIGESPNSIPQLLESTMNYLNSPWENIRANSVVIIGLLFVDSDATFAKEEDYKKNLKVLTFRLLQLLKDNNSNVRASAATALSNLYQII
ncbi:maestro heat like repeat family protein c11.1 [Arctopsyche grandis]|uniref:maestro heat like repeat family protein c11.1 n=1 Tax=Arctopsyche grandis TaxID=121162 RepID=UPI00406D8834